MTRAAARVDDLMLRNSKEKNSKILCIQFIKRLNIKNNACISINSNFDLLTCALINK